jgi:hypothetical protein
VSLPVPTVLSYGRLMASVGGAKRPVRILRTVDLPVIVRVCRRGETLVAVPAGLAMPDILALASVVLTGDEFAELSRQLSPLAQPVRS